MFIALSVLIITNNIDWFDNTRNILKITNIKTSFFKILTTFGDSFILILITILSFIIIKDKNYGKYIAINLAISAITNKILKHIFLRERPLDMLIDQGGYSYPSGHSFVSMAFYGLIIYFISKSKLNTKYKKIIIPMLILLIALIGVSRVYLKVHFPSDVIGGFISGLLYLVIYIEIINKIEGAKNEKK